VSKLHAYDSAVYLRCYCCRRLACWRV